MDAPAGSSPIDLRGVRVLLVEDSLTHRLLLSAVLSGAGASVVAVEDAASGLAACIESRPDLVLTDLMLPDDSGIELCGWIVAEPALRGTPVVILTASTDPDLIVRGLSVGAEAFLNKATPHDEIVARLARILARRRQPAPRRPALRFRGEELPLDGDVGRITDILGAALEDMAQLGRALRQKEERSRGRYLGIADAVPVGIAVSDLDGRLRQVNRRAQELVGLRAGQDIAWWSSQNQILGPGGARLSRADLLT